MKLGLAVSVVAAVVLLAGCSDNSGGTTQAAHSAAPQTSAVDQPPIPLPTSADLNAGMVIMFDANSTSPVKTNAIQGSAADPALADRLGQAAKAANMTMTVTSVEYKGNGLMNAHATLTVNGQPVQGETVIPFVADAGRWKVQKTWACQMLANASLQSPACT